MSDEKIIGFRMPVKEEAKLKKDLYYQNIKKKEWLIKQLTICDSIIDLSIEKNEKWFRVPASEYEQLHGNIIDHHECTYQRILQHCINEKIPITFDNLLIDVKKFFKLNDINITRFNDASLEIIHIEHNTGPHYSNFLSQLITKMITETIEYRFVSSEVHDKTLTIKIQKC
jgi:hypothetical protein